MMTEALREIVHHGGMSVMNGQFRDAGLCQRRGNGGSYTASTGHDGAFALDDASSTQDTAHKALTVEHVSINLPSALSRTALQAPATEALLENLVQESGRDDLVRHGDKRAVDVGKLE